MKQISATCMSIIALVSCAVAHAETDIIEFTVGGWNHDPSGYVQYQGTQTDLQHDMKLDAETQGFARLNIAHGVPILPNLQLAYTRLDHAGSGTLDASFIFGGTTFSAGEDVKNDLSMNLTDVVLFFSPLDNVAEFDIGLNVRRLDGLAVVRSITTSSVEQHSFDVLLPLLYARLGFDLPFSGLSAGVSGTGGSYDGNRMTDLSAYVRYKMNVLGIEGGYRRISLNADDLDGVSTDTDIEGPYLGIMLNF